MEVSLAPSLTLALVGLNLKMDDAEFLFLLGKKDNHCLQEKIDNKIHY